MSEGIWVVLIPAISAIVVAGFTLLRQVLTDRKKTRAEQTERHLTENDHLLREYRRLLEVHRTDAEAMARELARERDAHRDTATDRDQWRDRAQRNEQTIEKWIQAKEPPK